MEDINNNESGSSAAAAGTAVVPTAAATTPAKLAKSITGPEIVKKLKKALKRHGAHIHCVDGEGFSVLIARCWRIATKYGVSAESLTLIVQAYIDLYGSAKLVEYLGKHPTLIATAIASVGKMAVLALTLAL